MNKQSYPSYIKTLKQWAYAYYVEDNPLATDEEYDELYHAVLDYETMYPEERAEDSPTLRVGGMVREAFSKGTHIKRMWSMEDVFTLSQVQEWLDRTHKKVESSGYFCEPKFDGASMNLLYEKGVLVSAITRGDGLIGENVTDNVRTMHSVPLRIDYEERIEIRGEVVIRKDDFEAMNKERAKEGLYLFSNPRNSASGSLRQLDSSVTAKRRLVFYPWGLGENTLSETKLSSKMDFIYTLGFLSPPHVQLCQNTQEIEAFYQKLITLREDIPMMMDGMVIKIDEIDKQEILGYTGKFPKWMCAYKFPAVEKVTQVNAMTIQVGRTGVLTPVAELEPVEIDGAIISRATLHNFEEIERKGLMIHDSVILIRSGDVIPKITKVLSDRRDGTQIPILRPTHCPTCQSEVLDEGIQIKCPNMECSDRVIMALSHFASKSRMNIDGLGSKIVEILVTQNKVKDILGLYTLKAEDLEGLDGFKEKRISKLLLSIADTKGTDLARVLSAIGIEHIGQTVSKVLAETFGLEIINVSQEALIAIDGVGEEMAKSLVEYMQNNQAFVLALFAHINPSIIQKVQAKENPFKGKSIVLTGTMSQGREVVKKMLEDLGAKIASSVSKKTDFLIYGEKAGSKLTKADTLGVKTLDEEAFMRLSSF
ncbi:MAG: NAD-dependent DNA ligase LigA [Sulfurovum sp.]|nr:NAD-dependent DNA ligase LigA [Sulfurovum sp.]